MNSKQNNSKILIAEMLKIQTPCDTCPKKNCKNRICVANNSKIKTKKEKIKMVLDFKNDQEFVLANGVKPENYIGETHYKGKKLVRDITFRNFKNLCLEDSVFVDCTFEDCKCVTISSCDMNDCVFKNVDGVDGFHTNFTDCQFENCSAEDSLLVIDSKGQVDGCTFKNISAPGYIIYSVYGKKQEIETIENCNFINCRIGNLNDTCCYCSHFKPFSSYNTIRVNNVNYESCNFENCSSRDLKDLCQ